MKKLLLKSITVLLIIMSQHGSLVAADINGLILSNKQGAVQGLINSGVQLNIGEKKPLDSAGSRYVILGDNLSTIQLLLENGADPDAQDSSGLSVLQHVKVYVTFSPVMNTRKKELITLLEEWSLSLVKPAKK